MSQDKRKLKREAKNKRKKRFQIILISVVFIYLFFRSVPSLFASTFKTVLPEPVIVEDKVKTEAIIIKRENVYKADIKGKIEYISNEGEKIATGSRVVNLISLDSTSILNQELEELEEKITILTETEKDNDIIKDDEEIIGKNIDETIKELQDNIAKGNYENSEVLKGKLSNYCTKHKDITGDNTLLNKSLDNLKEKHKEIKEQITSNTISYFPGQAGIISYSIDGYEEIYSFSHKDDYTYNDFKSISDKNKKIENHGTVEAGEPIFKVIDNFEWYMILKINDLKDIATYEEGDSILLSSSDIGEELRGTITNIKEEDGKALVQCKFNSNFDNYYDKRFIDINIIKYKYDGFKIPTKSIVDKNGKKGVYVKEFSGIIKFKPIIILKEEDKITYIKKGDKNNNIDVEGNDGPVKTVTNFDEVFRNTIKLEEGMVVN